MSILEGLEAIRARPGMHGLTQEEADRLTCRTAHERFQYTLSPPKCNDGWVHIQHPMKPIGVTMMVVPCDTCNADQRFSLPQPTWTIT